MAQRKKLNTQHHVVTAFLNGTSVVDRAVIEAIARRAVKGAKEHGHDIEQLEIEMDLMCAHKFTGLDLEQLAAFEDHHFFHDIYGIRRFLNRDTGQLGGCFLPRCARKQP